MSQKPIRLIPLKFFGLLLFSILFSLSSSMSLAGGPINVTPSGVAVNWGDSPTVDYHTEEGSCSTLSNSEILTKLQTVFDIWNDLTEAEVTYSAVDEALTSINSTNYETYFYTGSGTTTNNATLTDGFNPIVFDDDGEITAALAGSANKFLVLGLTQITAYSLTTAEIADAQMVLNCRCVETHPTLGACTSGGNIITLAEGDLDWVILHEGGHYVNLDHSQVNFDLWNNSSSVDDDDVPIMFPVSHDTTPTLNTPSEDDIAAMAALYPSTSFLAERCLIVGDLQDEDGNAVRCADVQATTSDTADTMAFISGAKAVAQDLNNDGDTVDAGECESNCGRFELYLDPEKISYTLTVQPIFESFIVGSSVGPCVNAQADGIEEEVIATITATECVAGETYDLGDITISSSGTSSTDGNGTGTGNNANDDKNPIGYWCAISKKTVKNPITNLFLIFASIILFSSVLIVRYLSKKNHH